MTQARVGVLTTSHSALDARVFHKECRSLQQAGYDVTLLASLDDAGFLLDPAGKRIAAGETTLHGVKIIGFTEKRQGIPKISGMLRLLKLATIGGFRPGLDPLAELIEKGTKLSADIYHCHEAWSLYAAIQIKKNLAAKGKKSQIIYDVHEFPVASSPLIKSWIYRLALRKTLERFYKKALPHTDYVITANQITRGYLLALNRFIQTGVIYNCPSPAIFKEPPVRVESKDKVTICHEGSLGFSRGLREMIEVVKILKQRYGDRVTLLIVGDVFGEERKYLDGKLDEYDLRDSLSCTGWLPYEKVGEAISLADMGIIFMEPTESIMLSGPPNKLFNYMMYGLPVVSVDLPETSRIISETACGVVVKDRSVNSLAGALSALIDDNAGRQRLGENARDAFNKRYNWNNMEKKLLNIYHELLNTSDSGPASTKRENNPEHK